MGASGVYVRAEAPEAGEQMQASMSIVVSKHPLADFSEAQELIRLAFRFNILSGTQI